MTAVSSSAGIAAAWAATKQDATQQALQIAIMKQQQQADEGVVAMLESAASNTPPPAPPEQGRYVDIQV